MKVPYTPESFRESRMVRAYPEWFGKIPNGSGNPRMIRDPELFEETTAHYFRREPLPRYLKEAQLSPRRDMKS